MKDTILETITEGLNLSPGKPRKHLLKFIIGICRNNNYKIDRRHSKILLDLVLLSMENKSYLPVMESMVSVISNFTIGYNKDLLLLTNFDWFETATEEEIKDLIKNLILSEWT